MSPNKPISITKKLQQVRVPVKLECCQVRVLDIPFNGGYNLGNSAGVVQW